MDLESLSEALDKIGKFDVSAFVDTEPTIPHIDYSKIASVTINPEKTIIGEIKKQIVAQNELAEQQIGILAEQNKLLLANYDKLQEMYNSQKESYNDARKDLEKSCIFNRWMMFIAIIAMLAAIAGPIATFLVSG